MGRVTLGPDCFFDARIKLAPGRQAQFSPRVRVINWPGVKLRSPASEVNPNPDFFICAQPPSATAAKRVITDKKMMLLFFLLHEFTFTRVSGPRQRSQINPRLHKSLF